MSECAICFDIMIAVDVDVVPTCKHCFHKTCLNTWVAITPTCPLCRQPTTHKGDVALDQNYQNPLDAIDEMDDLDTSLMAFLAALPPLSITSHQHQQNPVQRSRSI